jgi:putative Mg2+ transporter-C (MgtC) family protein
VCLGTMLFARLGNDSQGGKGDPARVLGQIVTGIGFLGGGLMLPRDGHVKGVTSAAVVWIVAGIGAAIALDEFGAAIALTLVTLFVLGGVQQLEKVFRALRRGVHAPERASSAASKPPRFRTSVRPPHEEPPEDG